MRNDEPTRMGFSWMGLVLLIGHLAIIAGLSVSALTDRPPTRPPSPSPSILDTLTK